MIDLIRKTETIVADTNELQGNQANWATATGFNTVVPDAAGVAPTVGEIRTEMEGAGSKILAIEGDTNELQTNQGAWATATGFSTHSAANVWSVATRILTANTNFNDLTAAAVKAEAVAALADIKLDHLINIGVDTNWGTTVHLDSVIGHIVDVGTAATFDRTTDSSEAIRNRGDAAWVTGAGGSSPTVGEIRAEMEGVGYFLDLIKGDTNELQTNQGNWLTATGFNTVTPDAAGVAAGLHGTTDGHLTDIKGTGFAKDTHSLPQALTATGFNTVVPDAAGVAPTVVEIRTEMDTNSTKMAPSQVLADYKATGFSTHTAANVWSVGTRALTDKAGFSLSVAGVKAIWDQLTNVLTTAGSVGKLVVDNINAAITSRAPANEYDTEMGYIPADLGDVATVAQDNSAHGAGSWATATGFNTVVPDVAGTAAGLHTTTDGHLTDVKGTGFVKDTSSLPQCLTATGFATENPPSQVLADYKATGFNTVVPDVAGTAAGLHGTTDGKIDTVDGNVDSILIDTGTTLPARFTGIEGTTFDTATDSNEAIRDRGDTAWITGGAGTITVDDIVTGIFTRVTEGTLTYDEMIKIGFAMLAGKSDGGGTATATFRNVEDTKDRITATVTAAGNRTAITLDGA